MLLHSSDAVAAAMFASRCYDNAATRRALHVPAPAAAGNEPVPHLSVQSLPTFTTHFHIAACHALHLIKMKST